MVESPSNQPLNVMKHICCIYDTLMYHNDFTRNLAAFMSRHLILLALTLVLLTRLPLSVHSATYSIPVNGHWLNPRYDSTFRPLLGGRMTLWSTRPLFGIELRSGSETTLHCLGTRTPSSNQRRAMSQSASVYLQSMTRLRLHGRNTYSRLRQPQFLQLISTWIKPSSMNPRRVTPQPDAMPSDWLYMS
jgi:hypothetical protein